MGLSEREKGARGEREVCGLLHAYGWPNAERTSRGIAQAGRNDIANGPEGCALEVKFQERLNVPKALDQLVRDSDPTLTPILIHRPSRHTWQATLPLVDLLPLLALRERG